MSSKELRKTTIFTTAMQKALDVYGLKQKDISIKTGISTGRINEYIWGKTDPTLDNIIKIANIFELNIVEFLALGRGDEVAVEKKAEPDKKDDDTGWKERYYSESESHKKILAELNQVRKEKEELLMELNQVQKELGDLRVTPTVSGMETVISISPDD